VVGAVLQIYLWIEEKKLGSKHFAKNADMHLGLIGF
jgi:hypothetical protein